MLEPRSRMPCACAHSESRTNRDCLTSPTPVSAVILNTTSDIRRAKVIRRGGHLVSDRDFYILSVFPCGPHKMSYDHSSTSTLPTYSNIFLSSFFVVSQLDESAWMHRLTVLLCNFMVRQWYDTVLSSELSAFRKRLWAVISEQVVGYQ